MDIRIRKGEEIDAAEFPLITEALEYFDVMMDVDDFGVSYFTEQVRGDSDYAVMTAEDFGQLDERSRRHLRERLQSDALDGRQSPDDLAAFVDSLRLNHVERVVADIAELHARGLTAAEKAAIDDTVQRVEGDYLEGAAPGLDELLANPNVDRPLDSDSPFLELPEADPQLLERIRSVRMPAYFILDVSYSMAFESRIDYANAFVQRLSGHLRKDRVSDEIACLIYWGEHRFVDLRHASRFHVGESTATGQALRVVGDEIRRQHAEVPVFVALVTDGVPNCPGTHEGVDYSPVDYTVRMASLLPDNVVFSQIAFAPIDPGDPDRPENLEDFQRYLNDLKRVTDAARHGQTCVLVRQSEQHLPWLPLGAWQKARHLTLVDQSFSVVEDL